MLTTRTCHAALGALLCLATFGCATPDQPQTSRSGAADRPAESGNAALAAPPALPAGTEADVKYPVPGASAADLAGTASAFATRNALYEPVRFADLPGWSSDDVAQSWEAFRHSCAVLAGKPGWSAPCAAARGVDERDAASVRRFFERNFTVYQIRNIDRTPNGLMTGYYEPTLNGSLKRTGAYVYPVYGVPHDMLFLDQRRLPPNARDEAIAVRIENRTVVPLASVSSGNLKGVYALALGDSVPDIRDKKLRLRLDGNRVVPYYSRAEIERSPLNAPVLAYVDDPAMLYSMQLQGAGRIRLPDGSIVRLAYAEQNGYAFNPPIANARTKGKKVLVRGVEIDLEEGEASVQNADDDTAAGTATGFGGAPDEQPRSPLLRGADRPDGSGDAAIPSGNAARPAGDDRPDSPLLRGFNLVKSSTPAAAHWPTPAVQQARPAVKAAENAPPLSGKPYLFAASDSSYVFFKTIPDSKNGPIGALGVPLSAGRSAAIDPRTTPLGAPVFVSTGEASAGAVPMTRLVMAQDAGGAIRGAVRVDFFFGSGPQAQAQASKTRQPAQMWLLLPNGLKIAAKESRVRVRGAAVAPTLDCVVSDPDLCVENGP